MFWTPEKIQTLWRYPDKPVHAQPPKLLAFEERNLKSTEWVAQVKL